MCRQRGWGMFPGTMLPCRTDSQVARIVAVNGTHRLPDALAPLINVRRGAERDNSTPNVTKCLTRCFLLIVSDCPRRHGHPASSPEPGVDGTSMGHRAPWHMQRSRPREPLRSMLRSRSPEIGVDNTPADWPRDQKSHRELPPRPSNQGPR